MRRTRRAVLATATALLVVGTGTAALLDRDDLAVAGLAVLVGAALWVVVDVRLRAADLAHMLRLAAARHRELAAGTRQTVDAAEKAARAAQTARERAEASEARLLAVAETERLRSFERSAEVMNAIAEIRQTLERGVPQTVREAVRQGSESMTTDVVRQVGRLVRDERSDLEALLQVLPTMPADRLLPATGNWAMNARSLTHLLELVRTERPRSVLELGSGTSTIWLGLVLRQYGGRLISVESDGAYAAATRREVDKHGLGDVVDLRVAPLVDQDGAEGRRWYDLDAIGDTGPVDLLLVDGPPKSTGELARWPAVQLFDRLGDGALVVLDDALRPDEQAAVARWTAEYEGIALVEPALDRLAVLRVHR